MRLIDADLVKLMLMHRARLVHYGFEDRLCVPYNAVDEVPTVGDAVLGKRNGNHRSRFLQLWRKENGMSMAKHECEKCQNSRPIISENGWHYICTLSVKKSMKCMKKKGNQK